MDRESREGSTARARTRAPVGWIGAAAIAGIALVLTVRFVMRAESASTHGATPGAAPGTANGSRAPAHEAPLARPAEPVRVESPTPAPHPPSPSEVDTRSFQGRGRIRGDLVLNPGVREPGPWTLVLEPHPYLQGSEFAITKRVEFQAGARSFDVVDLPLGGYNVRAEVPGLNSSEAGVILVVASSNVHVTIVLDAAGLLDGRVLDASGAPAENVPVVLEARRGNVRRMQWTGPTGGYAFHDVVNGAYVLYVGLPESPLVPPGEIAFQAPTLRFPDARLPPTGALELHVRDDLGRSVGPCAVTGFGAPRGAVEARGDDAGECLVDWLVPGKYRIEARADDGRIGRLSIEVQAGPRTEHVIVVRP